MYSLVAANLLQRTKVRPFSDAEAEDRYYQSHSPRSPRLFSLLRLAAIVAVLALVLDVSAR
jgi:hypothetical protein